MFAPGGASRGGQPGVDIIDDQSNHCPTDHSAAVFTIYTEMHRASAYWTQPDNFLPERWLVAAGHELYPVKGAYRAFKIGPQNCVVQGFVMTELRVVLACVVRQFGFESAYQEWDRLYAPGKRGTMKTYRGERAYQLRRVRDIRRSIILVEFLYENNRTEQSSQLDW